MKKTLKELKYSLYLSVHPFKGFWDIKYEKEGSLKTAIILLTMTILVTIAENVWTGYLFGGVSVHYNMLLTVSSLLFLYFAWCTANWCLTCLSDGKGTFKDIAIFTAYSMTPYIIIRLIMIVVSNTFILREEVFYNMLGGLSLTWVAFLLITGMLTTHHFTLTRTLVVLLFTLVGMIVIALLIVLVFAMLQEVLSFVSTVVDELLLRYS
jgi:hypothetical protein